jgi:hypothetical protein
MLFHRLPQDSLALCVSINRASKIRPFDGVLAFQSVQTFDSCQILMMQHLVMTMTKERQVIRRSRASLRHGLDMMKVQPAFLRAAVSTG